MFRGVKRALKSRAVRLMALFLQQTLPFLFNCCRWDSLSNEGMLQCLLHGSCRYRFATSRLSFISLTTPHSPGQFHCRVQPGPRLTQARGFQGFFAHWKLGWWCRVKQEYRFKSRTARARLKSPSQKHLFSGFEIIPNSQKWLGFNSTHPPHQCIWFITFTFCCRLRGVLIGKLPWRRRFITSLFLSSVAGAVMSCHHVCNQLLTSVSSSTSIPPLSSSFCRNK